MASQELVVWAVWSTTWWEQEWELPKRLVPPKPNLEKRSTQFAKLKLQLTTFWTSSFVSKMFELVSATMVKIHHDWRGQQVAAWLHRTETSREDRETAKECTPPPLASRVHLKRSNSTLRRCHSIQASVEAETSEVKLGHLERTDELNRQQAG